MVVKMKPSNKNDMKMKKKKNGMATMVYARWVTTTIGLAKPTVIRRDHVFRQRIRANLKDKRHGIQNLDEELENAPQLGNALHIPRQMHLIYNPHSNQTPGLHGQDEPPHFH